MKNLSDIKVLYSEAEIQSAIIELADKLNDLYKGEVVYLVCILKGASFFATDLAKRLNMPLQIEFIKLSSYSGTKSSGSVTPEEVKLPDLNGKNVIIVEDIVDTGRTLKYTVDFLNNNFKMKDLKVCSLLNKQRKRAEQIEADYYLFSVKDEFVVGYGLDCDGYYRNLPYVGYLEE